ncbi:MAG: xanthine dehydrogenase FAD-binding subunit XdhB [Spirochaetaceae bacterium]|jgi:xanthine dehydrogenase FAD-binding subunit|nr:xanthine dehydrogenase FAD-binding subunit XdhB [Spirochaetaceae bacterium]
MYDIEALYEAESAAHAAALLSEHPEARVIAGGSDVLIEIREGKLAGCTLVSIQKLDELRGVVIDGDGSIRIGAMTSMSHITADPIIREHIPVLGEAADTVGGPQLRNIATIGGNVCNGVTSADTASTLMAWDAVMEYMGSGGTRRVPIKNHYTGAGKTSLACGEMLAAIIIPRESYENCFGYYIKYAMREALDIATLGCSANVRLSADKARIERLRLAYGVAGPVPLRAVSAEAAAAGKPASEASVTEAAAAVLNDVNPRTSWRASREFRLHLAEELAKRTIRESITRAGGAV